MPSPFPGMNPYLEQASVWTDFHTAFLTAMRESLTPQVRPNFFVKLEERVYIHEPSGDERSRWLGKPDIAILGSPAPVGPPTTNSSSTRIESTPEHQVKSVIASLVDVEIERHAFIEIRDRLNRELVTMIEVLSPTNKRHGPDREQYIAKRTSVLLSSATIVEIDLLRGGPRFPLQDAPPSDYSVAVFRKEQLPAVEVWPIGLRERLPTIPIPLKGDFPAASLDLQALLHHVYDAAGYEDYIYQSPPEPPLAGPDSEWATQILAAQ